MTSFNCTVCGRIAKGRKGNANRYCSQACVVASGMRRVSTLEQNRRRPNGWRGTLTDSQKREIARLRSGGKQHKEIARLVGCTVEQSKHYSYTAKSPAYVARKKSQKHALLLKASIAARAKRNADKAIAVLTHEIAGARAEAPHVPPYKPGPLEW